MWLSCNVKNLIASRRGAFTLQPSWIPNQIVTTDVCLIIIAPRKNVHSRIDIGETLRSNFDTCKHASNSKQLTWIFTQKAHRIKWVTDGVLDGRFYQSFVNVIKVITLTTAYWCGGKKNVKFPLLLQSRPENCWLWRFFFLDDKHCKLYAIN